MVAAAKKVLTCVDEGTTFTCESIDEFYKIFAVVLRVEHSVSYEPLRMKKPLRMKNAPSYEPFVP